jgi:Flp pilus assembly pilin Flp
MRCLRQDASDLLREVSGAVALEYGLIASLIIVAILGSLVAVRDALVNLPLQALVDAFIGALS